MFLSLNEVAILTREAPNPLIVTLGLDPMALQLGMAQQVQAPRVKPEGDGRG